MEIHIHKHKRIAEEMFGNPKKDPNIQAFHTKFSNENTGTLWLADGNTAEKLLKSDIKFEFNPLERDFAKTYEFLLKLVEELDFQIEVFHDEDHYRCEICAVLSDAYEETVHDIVIKTGETIQELVVDSLYSLLKEMDANVRPLEQTSSESLLDSRNP